MPFEFKGKPLFQISDFRSARHEDTVIEDQTGDKNHIFYIADGSCSITALGKELKITQCTLVYFARGIKYRIQTEKKDRCLLKMLELSETDMEPDLDLNELCVQNPSVDTFMEKKSRFCTLIDCENMYFTINELLNEMESELPEKWQMVATQLTLLFIKMARSFHLHGKPSGVQYITDAKRYIGEHYNQAITVQMIADYLGISRSYLQILFSRFAKRSIVTHINGVRSDKAAYLLATTNMSVLDISLATGYNSRQHFARAFREHTGLSPREYKKQRGRTNTGKNQ
jgi:AraC-like DNA-binding protein